MPCRTVFGSDPGRSKRLQQNAQADPGVHPVGVGKLLAQEQSSQEVKLTSHVYLVPRLMSGALSSLTYTPSQQRENFCLTLPIRTGGCQGSRCALGPLQPIVHGYFAMDPTEGLLNFSEKCVYIHKIDIVRCTEVYKHFCSLEAINHFVA